MSKTPLYDRHIALGGKIIDFGGWELPVQYIGIIEEHMAVRSSAGLFDVSHMGEIMVKGANAQSFLQRIVTNDITKMKDNQIVYSPICYNDGGVVDDVLIYKLGGEDYLVVVNAANTDKDFEWFLNNNKDKAIIENVSEKYAQLALQGPKAELILQKLTDTDLSKIRFFRFESNVKIKGMRALISRTGYTGEDGFELYIDPSDSVSMWNSILEAGKDEGLIPAGLGARDTLRFEAALPLYGHEISPTISPLEAGLGRFVKLQKDDFIGKDALKNQQQNGLQRHLVGFEMIDRGIARSEYEVEIDGRKIGFVTSGSYSPSTKKNLGMALVDNGLHTEDSQIDIIIRGRKLKAQFAELPFYKKTK